MLHHYYYSSFGGHVLREWMNSYDEAIKIRRGEGEVYFYRAVLMHESKDKDANILSQLDEQLQQCNSKLDHLYWRTKFMARTLHDWSGARVSHIHLLNP
jgi:hypothetical protein